MLQLNRRIADPRDDEEFVRSDDRIRTRPRVDAGLNVRSGRPGEAKPQLVAEFEGAFDIVAKAADALERAERQARTFRVNALKHFESYQKELLESRSEIEDLRAALAAREAELKDAELRVKAATLRAKDSEARLEECRKTMMSIEGELAGSRKWLSYFENHLADRFKNAARSLAEMTDSSFEGDEQE